MTKNTRPLNFDDYVGQERAKTIMKILKMSAIKGVKAVCHTMISGRAGLGKTTLCRILANEMDSNLIEIVASNLSDPQQLIAQLASLEKNDILFIDEIHSLTRSVEEILYSAMEDGKISVTIESDFSDVMQAIGMSSSKSARTIIVDLPPFTLMGATTLPEMVSSPLRSRFVQTLNLEPYSISDLQMIIMNAASKMNFSISKAVAHQIAKRSRATARIAISHLNWVYEYCNAQDLTANIATVTDAFDLACIDQNGLTKTDIYYLNILIGSPSRPIGLSSLSASLGESEKNIIENIEPYLMQEGFIRRANRGRVAEQKAFDLMNRKAA